uniref:protein ANKUB1-like isoform X2 n=1 Tax=Ciona intestinalis TaxID=7719 RepID=UPI0002B8D050|nr:protein ANKUB1-like isoform X2 [Ciona intestinalis]|eukprot:XP_002122024.2 protein ANKUB1-like isoform X2 [Ciona intestinalis]
MRIFIAFEDVRLPLDVRSRQTIGDVKVALRDHFKLNSSHVEDKILQLTYAGATLQDDWVCSDIGITSGATVKSALRESDKPVLNIHCAHNGDAIYIREQIEPSKTTVHYLRELIASKTGLPVSVFRLVAANEKEMFDGHLLKSYGVVVGSSIKLHVWDGWADLLIAASNGHTKKVIQNASHDEQVMRFQFRVACHMAAHFGHVDLANSMTNPKIGSVKPEEPVGLHPSKLWCKPSSHVDAWKCPVHVAVERGKLNVLRIFVQNNICCLIAKNGSGLTPIQSACRYNQTECLSYLTSKLYSSHTENSVTLAVVIVIKVRKWCERARERVLIGQGAFPSSLKRRPYKAQATVESGIQVDGFGVSNMTSRSKILEYASQSLHYTSQTLNHTSHLKQPITELISLTTRNSSNNASIKKGFSPDGAKLPGLNKLKSPRRIYEGDVTESSSYIQTPKPTNQLPSIDNEKRMKTRGGNTRRGNIVEGGLSLPAVSAENTLRPFFHVSSKVINPVTSTLEIFDKYRHLPARENAIQCMIVASTFKDKVWLRQVDLAVLLARRNVHTSLQRHRDRCRSIPTVASSPIKVR